MHLLKGTRMQEMTYFLLKNVQGANLQTLVGLPYIYILNVSYTHAKAYIICISL